MVEMMLNSYHHAYGLDFVAFRYFNACGADSQARHGQRDGATHIIARVLESIYSNSEFTLNGTDFPTKDGTCIRDYVHVEDIANSHVLAVGSTIPAGTYNLGNNIGTSNQQIIEIAQHVTGKTIKVKPGPQRAGDPAHLTASSEKFDKVAGNWKKFNLEDMVTHAWAWQQARSAK
jgi:UDP-glucose 4-epimerase